MSGGGDDVDDDGSESTSEEELYVNRHDEYDYNSPVPIHFQRREKYIKSEPELDEVKKKIAELKLKGFKGISFTARNASDAYECLHIFSDPVDTLSGLVVSASFDGTSRGPDEIVRRVRLTVEFEDPNWKGKLLETYDTRHDRFQIASCSWMLDWAPYSFSLLQLPDSEILSTCSTSPAAESDDFVENERRKWKYLVEHPDWRQTFTGKKPCIF